VRLPKDFSDWMQAFVVLIVIISLVGSTVTYFQTLNTEHRLARTAECLAKYNDANQRNLLERSELARRQIDNQTDFFRAVSMVKTRAEGLAAFQHYLDVQTAIDREKAQNPIAPPPSEVC